MFANKLVENAYKRARENGGKDGLNCIAAMVPEAQISADTELKSCDGAETNEHLLLTDVPILVNKSCCHSVFSSLFKYSLKEGFFLFRKRKFFIICAL